jgi:hypothetical protein
MNMPGFTAEASLEKTRGHYHSAHTFAEAGGNALLPAQRCCAPPPHPPLMPWGFGWRCVQQCFGRCDEWCPSGDIGCIVECSDPWCYVGCNEIVP